MYWCCSVTMQIDSRINSTSTTDQREEERKVKSVGQPFAAAGIGFRSVPLTHCRLLTHWLDATLRRDCLASERELICGS